MSSDDPKRAMAATREATSGARSLGPDDEDGACVVAADLEVYLNMQPTTEALARFEEHARICSVCLESLAFFTQLRLDGLMDMPSEHAYGDALVTAPALPPVAGAAPRGAARGPSKRAKRGLPRARLIPIAVAASVLVAFGSAKLIDSGNPDVAVGLRAKGDEAPALGPRDSLFLATERDGATMRLETGDRAVRGDRITFFYTVARDTHLVVFNVEPSSLEPTLLFPIDGGTGLVEAGIERPLGAGAVVGPAPGNPGDEQACEWIVAVFADAPLEIEQVRSHLASVSSSGCAFSPEVPGARSVTVITLRR